MGSVANGAIHQTALSRQRVSLDSMQKVGERYARQNHLAPTIDRIDVRPQKGVAKIVCLNHFLNDKMNKIDFLNNFVFNYSK